MEWNKIISTVMSVNDNGTDKSTFDSVEKIIELVTSKDALGIMAQVAKNLDIEFDIEAKSIDITPEGLRSQGLKVTVRKRPKKK